MLKLIFMLARWVTFFGAVFWAISGCSSRIAAMPPTAQSLIENTSQAIANTTSTSSIRRLRVEINSRVALLALGYTDAHPQGPVEVWYSTLGEVLRLQNGHVVGLTGSDLDWLQVRLSSMPAWPASGSSATSYSRIRDVMPGYRFGIVDRLSMRSIDAPSRSNLLALDAKNLRWFEALDLDNKLPAARFALLTMGEKETVVYAEQCLSRKVCLSWQEWLGTGADL